MSDSHLAWLTLLAAALLVAVLWALKRAWERYTDWRDSRLTIRSRSRVVVSSSDYSGFPADDSSPWGFYHCYHDAQHAREVFESLRNALSGAKRGVAVRGMVQLRRSKRYEEPNRNWLVLLVPRGSLDVCLRQGGMSLADFRYDDHEDGDMEFVRNNEKKSELIDEFVLERPHQTDTNIKETEHPYQIREAAHRLLVAHVSRVRTAMSDLGMQHNLAQLLHSPYLDFILAAVDEKIQQARTDNKPHSKQFSSPGHPFLSVAVHPCSLDDLSANFQQHMGLPYGRALPKYYENAMRQGASCFCHVFFCAWRNSVDVTLTYCGAGYDGLVLPREFQHDFPSSV